jgi:hypothetical protein
LVQKLENLPIFFKPYPDEYFNSMATYNVFLTMKSFYLDFYQKGFTHILICHIDAYTFKDDLEYWCKKDISYIGAPWFIYQNNHSQMKFVGSGNGGFSLRRISDFLSVINKIKTKPKYNNIFVKLYLSIAQICNGNFIFYRYFIRPFSIGNIHEDTFWAMSAQKIDRTFKVADERQSISFAFETYPEILFQKNDNQLPFGCHSWENYNPEFWKKFIN